MWLILAYNLDVTVYMYAVGSSAAAVRMWRGVKIW